MELSLCIIIFVYLLISNNVLDRKKVLQHHPDKKGLKRKQFDIPGLNQHEYFTCITKAYEILSNVSTRRAYDSIDPTFNEDVPSNLKGDFFEVFGPVFVRNARYCNFNHKVHNHLISSCGTNHVDFL